MNGRRDAGGGLRHFLVGLAALGLAQCAWFPARAPAPAPVPPPVAAVPDYWQEVRPVLAARCVVCHACYDAPCQLNLASPEGVARGASRDVVYSTVRLRNAQPTRLFLDEATTAGWRARGFYSVVDGNLMMGMLSLKQAHPLPAEMPLPKEFDLNTGRSWNCPKPDDFESFASKNPLWGMPFGLPGLEAGEYRVLTAWLAAGAPAGGPPPLAPAFAAQVAEWEAFLNGATPKERLMSRYLYEHLFLGSLYFSELPGTQFFRLVRSRTPPGQPVQVIATRLPFDDPGATDFWYRLVRSDETPVAKTHMPYALNPGRMARYRSLFVGPAVTVTALPGYAPDVAGNPFVVYRDLPVESRYRFLLDDAEFFMRGFMKGPVCRGDVAVDVIEDRFWVFFSDPDSVLAQESRDFLARESANLRLPDGADSGLMGLAAWRRYKDLQQDYLKAKQAYLLAALPSPQAVTLDLVWDGDGTNSNAALTIFRNADNATVVRGLLGGPPKTAWIMNYPLFERIHYLLVAGYDVYGTTGAQLDTRLYMDFMRMEGEFNFLALLPEADRVKVRDYWYRGASDSVREYVYGARVGFDRETGINYRTGDSRVELMQMLEARLKPVLSATHDVGAEPDPALRAELLQLAALDGLPVSLMPELSFLAVVDGADGAPRPERIYTLLKDTAHTNVASLFGEEKRLIPAEDELTVARRFVGAYPNAFYRVPRDQLPAFRQAIAALAGEADYRALVARFGVERTSPGFWANSDALARANASLGPVEAGVFDYARLENR